MRESLYRRYLLSVLLVILAFNGVDSVALGLVLQDIKTDLRLSDTQLGVLSGIAFALFYSVMGIPIARWADRGNRITIISVTVALWSVMVGLCAMASSFAQLLVIRIGVAVGEAGCIPPAHSLIADHFSRAERPRAVAIFMLGTALSTVIGYFVAGWLNQLYGWRLTFLIVGLPGTVLGLLAWLTLKEPRLTESIAVGDRAVSRDGDTFRKANAHVSADQPSLLDVCQKLWADRTFRHLVFCFSVINFFGYGILQWLPAYLIRSYGLKTGELGTWFAVIYTIAGVGTYWGGELASRYAPGDERKQLKAMAIVYAFISVASSLIYLAHTYAWALGWLGLSAVAGATTSGPLFATIQTLVPQHMRATSIAFIYLFANLIGMGLGPLIAGALSDALRPWAGEESLRYALLALCPGYLWGAWHLWRASHSVSRDVAAARALEAETLAVSEPAKV